MSQPEQDRANLLNASTEIAIRLGVVGFLIYSCAIIFRPFVMAVLWGAIIAVALNPLYKRLESIVGGRAALAATIFSLTGLAVIVVPAIALSGSFVEGVHLLETGLHERQWVVPPPPEAVASSVRGDRP